MLDQNENEGVVGPKNAADEKLTCGNCLGCGGAVSSAWSGRLCEDCAQDQAHISYREGYVFLPDGSSRKLLNVAKTVSENPNSLLPMFPLLL